MALLVHQRHSGMQSQIFLLLIQLDLSQPYHDEVHGLRASSCLVIVRNDNVRFFTASSEMRVAQASPFHDFVFSKWAAKRRRLPATQLIFFRTKCFGEAGWAWTYSSVDFFLTCYTVYNTDTTTFRLLSSCLFIMVAATKLKAMNWPFKNPKFMFFTDFDGTITLKDSNDFMV